MPCPEADRIGISLGEADYASFGSGVIAKLLSGGMPLVLTVVVLFCHSFHHEPGASRTVFETEPLVCFPDDENAVKFSFVCILYIPNNGVSTLDES